jgi:hypothetical protein
MTKPRALATDANERSEDKPGASYIWALVIGSVIDEGTQGVIRQWSAPQFSGIVSLLRRRIEPQQ